MPKTAEKPAENQAVYVTHAHPLVDEGPAEWEPSPPTPAPALLALEPIPSVEDTHPVIDSGPTVWEPHTTPGIINAPPRDPEPIPNVEHQHPIVDAGPALVEPNA